ncbi:MAG: tetratricopeptide repeat protein [Planctomycetota bacterium]|jgi:tetratricopeptide (TPR) repeat protein
MRARSLQIENSFSGAQAGLVRILLFTGLTIAVFFSSPALAQLRKTKVGDKIPEFSLGDANAVVFEYKHNRGRVLAIAFLSPKQHQSEQAVDDIGQILRDLRRHGVAFDFIGVVGEGADSNSLTLGTQDPNSTFAMFPDAGYRLWGKFGIVATPTVLIAGKDDVVLWIKAGYGYDFAPALRAHLSQALGLLKDSEVEESTKVKTLNNTSALARLRRHIQMAKLLEQKGQVEAAVAEMRRARQLDPNSVTVAIELGEILCRTNQSQAALDAVKGISATEKIQKAAVLLISGWAKRQMRQVDAAEKLLQEATALDPKSSRAFFELGKVHQAKQEPQKAIRAYRRALALLFREPIEEQDSH